MLSFNSRPHKEVDEGASLTHSDIVLSIHDLTRRSTLISPDLPETGFFQFTTSQGGRHMFRISSYLYSTFNSRPHKEVDYQPHPPVCLHRPFNSRPHKEVDLSQPVPKSFHRSFNSRPHKEVDLPRRHQRSSRLSFQFTTSQGGRPYHTSMYRILFTFQFTTSQGGRRKFRQHVTYALSFNSRPHKEVDLTDTCLVILGDLSIHDLTRRSTMRKLSECKNYFLSIHDLTRRSTFSPA